MVPQSRRLSSVAVSPDSRSTLPYLSSSRNRRNEFFAISGVYVDRNGYLGGVVGLSGIHAWDELHEGRGIPRSCLLDRVRRNRGLLYRAGGTNKRSRKGDVKTGQA